MFCVVKVSFIFRFLVEKAEQVKLASIISAEGDTEAAELLATAFSKAGEGLVRLILMLSIHRLIVDYSRYV